MQRGGSEELHSSVLRDFLRHEPYSRRSFMVFYSQIARWNIRLTGSLMATANLVSPPIQTLADLQRRLGNVSLNRIRFNPPPGTATIGDVVSLLEHQGIICELVEGVLVEKTVGYTESTLAGYLIGLLNAFVIPRNLGIDSGPDGTIELMPDMVRIPDVAFTCWDRFPNRCRPKSPVPQIVPNLAVEVLSQGNSAAEMKVKRDDYFSAGVELVWEVDPELKTVSIYTSPTNPTILRENDILSGDTVLPGFSLALRDFFAELHRKG